MSETAKMDGGRKPPQRQASAKGDPVALKEVKSYISVTYLAFAMGLNFSS